MAIPPTEPTKGPTLAQGRYRLVDRLGEGGMAAVYRGWDTKLQRWVAVKALLPDLARRKKLRRRFENEAALMARIDHRHVISVFDVGTDGMLPYMVMELAEGGCIHDWSRRYGEMPPRLAVDVVMQVCKGIGAAHELGVIHRDIKPHNVLVTHRGVCKVTDFGIAQINDDEAGSLTRTGSVMGTMGYMAPEQRNDAKNVDQRADVYSIGATLYALLTRRSVADLFLAEHDQELLQGVPEALSPVILKATTYRPEDRYEDVAQLARALHEAKKDLPAIPDDTPSLVMPPDPSSTPDLDGPSEPTFPEIEALLSADSGITPLAEKETAHSDAPKAARPLPYLMPEQAPRDARSAEDLPDYIDPSSLDQAPLRQPEDIDLSAEEKAALEARMPQEASETPSGAEERDKGSLDMAENFVDLVWSVFMGFLRAAWKPMSAIAIPGLLFGSLFFGVVGYGAMEVNNAAQAAHSARAEVYATLEAERLVIDELVALGASRQGLEAVFSQAAQDRPEPDRYDAAMRYIRLLESQLRTVTREPSPTLAQKVGTVRQRINRIQLAVAAYDEAVLAWEAVAQGSRGSMAVSLGVASSP